MSVLFRPAAKEDIKTLTTIRLEIFREAGSMSGRIDIQALETEIQRYFLHNLNKDFWCWVAEDGGEIIAAAGCNIYQKLPHAKNISGREGYIVNVYTRPDYRKKGIAGTLVKNILQWMKGADIHRVRLHATPDGKTLYEGLGFIGTGNEMEVFL